MPHHAAEAVVAAQAWMQGARPSPSNEARQLMPNRAAMLANLVGGPGIFVDPLKKPPPRPVGCEGRLLRSPVLSSAPVDNLAYFHRTKLFKMANLTQVTHLARRAHVPLAYQRARTCAVVGSSSKLLDAAEGSLIDASELVFRMNHAPVLPELRAYIGSRTDVHVDPIQLHGAFGSINASDATSSQIYTCTSNHDYPGCLTFSPKLSSVSGPHDRRTCKHCGARVLAGVSERWDRTFPGLDQYARALMDSTKMPKGRFIRPTTGFVALLLALHVCDEARLFGFGMSARTHCSQYKFAQLDEAGRPFFDMSRSDRVHNYNAEQQWIATATRNYTRTTLTCRDLPLVYEPGDAAAVVAAPALSAGPADGPSAVTAVAAAPPPLGPS
ncbi:hypothetical protein EMIHUDRAFT_106270 [Emiliania huxleyi CCMP1516]|uniref:Uncharacterized protein n=2 Tax=Emiliania huxleyi TaxID=2903 RepID=A0A0D3I9G7_EMIH1|nr:hypothetical protein EMIHUDRAFT_106270 [Emiliania huxleyi CCMP1516]EOD07902.1 hypothetical protein EMIHUDRAFT_106270 [Emiliania huxleyi CCMP1516]|eukprot:XP_005760331.1 hypothetical protein EMIHUDRAFT_106270 [Emiliania huxleyi CCMP1516]